MTDEGRKEPTADQWLMVIETIDAGGCQDVGEVLLLLEQIREEAEAVESGVDLIHIMQSRDSWMTTCGKDALEQHLRVGKVGTVTCPECSSLLNLPSKERQAKREFETATDREQRRRAQEDDMHPVAAALLRAQRQPRWQDYQSVDDNKQAYRDRLLLAGEVKRINTEHQAHLDRVEDQLRKVVDFINGDGDDDLD